MKPRAQDPNFSAQPINRSTGPVGDDPFKPDIVNNIPMHKAAPAPAQASEDDELDKIMQDVGTELKKDDHQPAKHHFFSKTPKPTVNAPVHPPAAHHSAPQAPAHPPTAQQPKAPAKPAPKIKAKSSAPVFVIVVTVLVTGVLIAAAVSAYK